MTVFTKAGQQIFAPVDESGNARTISPQEAQVWSTEVERGIKIIEQNTELINSPFSFDATGDGTTDDSVNYALAEAANSNIFLPTDAVFDLGSSVPTKPVYGPGGLIIGGIEVGGFQLDYEADRGNIFFSPGAYFDPAIDPENPGTITNTTPPTVVGVQRYSNVFINPGGSNFNKDRMWRNTVVGEGAFRIMEDAERTEAFGNSAFGYARYSERNSGFGTLVMQWLGQDLSRDPIKYFSHDIWYNGGTLITDPAWDYEGLATRNPGIRATILAYTDWAASRTDVTNNSGFGRDSLVHLLKGVKNSGHGYRSLAHLINGDSNSALGDSSLMDLLFGDDNVAVGASAGYRNQTGNRNTFVGVGAGSGLISGNNNLMLGVNAGVKSTLIAANGNVWIGRDAGRDLNVATDDTFLLQNLVSRVPLMSGNFASPKLGINIAPGEIKGTFHVRSSYFGADVAANSGADDFIVENNGAAGISIRSSNSTVGSLLFADPEGSGQGGMQYAHATDRLSLRAGNSDRMFITSTGIGFNGTAAIAKPTGVAVTAAAIHAALVSYGLISA